MEGNNKNYNNRQEEESDLIAENAIMMVYVFWMNKGKTNHDFI